MNGYFQVLVHQVLFFMDFLVFDHHKLQVNVWLVSTLSNSNGYGDLAPHHLVLYELIIRLLQIAVSIAHFYFEGAEQHIVLMHINIEALHSIFNCYSSYFNHAVLLIERDFDHFLIDRLIFDFECLEVAILSLRVHYVLHVVPQQAHCFLLK